MMPTNNTFQDERLGCSTLTYHLQHNDNVQCQWTILLIAHPCVRQQFAQTQLLNSQCSSKGTNANYAIKTSPTVTLNPGKRRWNTTWTWMNPQCNWDDILGVESTSNFKWGWLGVNGKLLLNQHAYSILWLSAFYDPCGCYKNIAANV